MTTTHRSTPPGSAGRADRSLDRLFSPASVAVIGASTAPAKLGSVMLSVLSTGGAHVPVYGVNPHGADDRFCPSLSAAAGRHGGPIDLAVLCVRAGVAPAVLRAAAACGTGAAVICSGGFAEAGPAGARLQAQVSDVVRDTGIRVLGPNTSGFFRPGTLSVSFVPAVRQIRPGNVAVIAASGGVNHALSFLLSETGVGVGLGVGLGNAVDVDHAAVIDHVAGDPGIRAIALHVESVRNGNALMDAVRRASTVKPVVAIVVGRSDISSFAASHTGALATGWRTTRALLAEAGAVVVDTEQELVDAVAALSRTRLPAAADPGVALVTAQAGPGLMILDQLLTAGVRVPRLSPETRDGLSGLLPAMTFQENPVDTGRPGASFPAVLSAVASDPQIDALAAYALAEPEVIDPAEAAHTSGAADRVPVLLGVGGPAAVVAPTLRRAAAYGLPAVTTPTAVAHGVLALVRDSRARWLASRTGPLRSGPAAPAPPLPADEAAAKDFLQALGITTPQRRVCPDHASARSALQELGAPVAVKILDASVLHKSDAGGVRLGIRTPDRLERALNALDAMDTPAYLVEAMADPGIDLILGARRDPVFGPVIIAGIGGTATEAVDDIAIRSADLTPTAAATMLDDLRGARLLRGWRGGPTLDPDEFAHAALALAQALREHPQIADIEINPLRLTAGGLIALDAVIVPTTPPVEG